LIFLLVFFIGWAALIYIIASSTGNPYRALAGLDMNGNRCGFDTSVASKPLAVWPNPLYYKAIVCVSDCSVTLTDGNFMVSNYPTKAMYGRYCVPDVSSSAWPSGLTDGVSTQLNSFYDQITRQFGDLVQSAGIFLITAAIAIVLSFLFIFLSRFVIGYLVWLTLLGLLIAGAVCSAYWYRAYSSELGSDMKNLDLAIFIVCAAFTFIVFCVSVFLRTQINISINVIKESSRAMGDLVWMIVFPLLPAMLTMAYLVLAIYGFSMVYTQTIKDAGTATNSALLTHVAPTVGTVGSATTNPTTTYGETYSTTSQYYLIYIFFHVLWMIQFSFYFAYTTMAGTVCSWYFAARDESGAKVWSDGSNSDQPGVIPSWPIFASMYRVIRYHLGTISLAAFIIAVVQLIRYAVAYVQEQFKDSENFVAKCLLCTCQCFLCCLECCLDKINKNSLIWCSIMGDNFCTSCCASTSLIMGNLARAGTINGVSFFVLFLVKYLIVLTSTGIGGFIITGGSLPTSSSSTLIPLFIMFIIAFAIASLIIGVFEGTIDTIFFCFLVDEDCNAKKGLPMCADLSLRELMDGFNASANQTVTKVAPSDEIALENRSGAADTNGAADTKAAGKPATKIAFAK
jgi:hypothetical protein